MSKYGQMATNAKETVKLALLVALLTFVVAFLKFVSILSGYNISWFARLAYSHFMHVNSSIPTFFAQDGIHDVYLGLSITAGHMDMFGW